MRDDTIKIESSQVTFDAKTRAFSDGKHLYLTETELARVGAHRVLRYGWYNQHEREPDLLVKVNSLDFPGNAYVTGRDLYGHTLLKLYRRSKIRKLVMHEYPRAAILLGLTTGEELTLANETVLS